jgi:hypothetical protein
MPANGCKLRVLQSFVWQHFMSDIFFNVKDLKDKGIEVKPVPVPVVEPAPVPVVEPAPVPVVEPAPVPVVEPAPPREPDGVDLFTEEELVGVNAGPAPGNAPIDAGQPHKRRGRPPKLFADTVNYRKFAEQMFDMTTGIATGALGPEWKPKNPEERESVVVPLEVYLRSQEIPDLPPGVVLAIVVCAYAAPRLREPATKEKIAGLIGKFKRKKRVLETAPPS